MSGFCPNCGAKLDAGTQFCTSCGAQVANVAPAGTVSAPAPKPARKRGRGRLIAAVAAALVLAAGVVVLVPGLLQPPVDIPFRQVASSDLGIPLRPPGGGDTPLGFTMAVPEHWTTEILDEPDGYSVVFAGPPGTAEETTLLGVSLIPASPGADLASLTEVYTAGDIAETRPLAQDTRRLAGLTAQHFRVSWPSPDTGVMTVEDAYFVQRGGFVYRFSFFAPEADYARVRPIFEHMLGALEFPG